MSPPKAPTRRRKKEGNNFNCPICDAPFNRKFNRDQHISSHTKDVPCRICALSFRSETILQSHLVAKHSSRQVKNYLSIAPTPVECSQCDQSFSSYYQLYFHDQNKHTPEGDEKPVECSQCDKFFPTETLLQHHILNKHPKRPDFTRTCDVCEKSFASRQSLSHHMLIHTGMKPVKCKDCDATFRCLSLYKQHRVSHHWKEAAFSCALCKQTFTRSNFLRKHLKYHFDQADGDKDAVD